MTKFNLYIALLFGITFLGCQEKTTPQEGVVIAEVANNQLFLSDIVNDYPNDQFNKIDSLAFVDDYITKWVKQQLLLNEAENKLTSQQLDIRHELENYREDLIIHKYTNNRIQSFNDTIISNDAVLAYYTNNKNKFLLKKAIVKIEYMIFPSEVHLSENFKSHLNSSNAKVISDREDFVFQYANKYDNFDNRWIEFNKINESINSQITNIGSYLKKHDYIKFTTKNKLHLIVIKAYHLKNEQAPFEFVSPRIKSMLTNSKKIDFLREIKDSLYNDALKYNKFRVLN